MLLFSISLNLFIVLVMVGLAFWGVYVLLFVGGRQAKKTKRPTPAAYTFFQPTAPGGNVGSFTGTVPLSSVNTDELRFGILDPGATKINPTTPLPDPVSAVKNEEQDGAIADDNPDFAIREDEFSDEEADPDSVSLAKSRQVMVVQATAALVGDPSPTPATTTFDIDRMQGLDEDVLNQVEAIFGNADQMELLDQFHTEANRVMLLTGEDYHTVFHRLIQNESEESRAYLTSMLVPADAPEPVMSLATVLAMSDEETIDS